MKALDTASFDAPEETIPIGEKARADLVTVGAMRVWKVVFEPGWRFSEDPGDLCPAPHAAYIASGRLGMRMEDGSEAEVGPGELIAAEPGHDAWTIGDEPCVFIDFGESVARWAAAA